MTEATLSQLKTKRKQIRTSTTNFEKFLNNFKDDDLRTLILRYGDFKPLLKRFMEVQDNIELLQIGDEAEEGEPEETERSEYETRYYNACTRAEELIEKLTISPSNASVDIKLPTIELPHFNGEYTSFTAFYESFRNLIHENKNLEKIQKLHYLRSALGPEPRRVIENLSLSADSYETAWRLLKERYQNKRLIVHNHLHGFFNLPNATNSPQSLRVLLDQTNVHLESLKNQGLDTVAWDPIIIYVLSSKFDVHTKREWESQLKNDELPTLTQLKTFLSQRCHTLESLEYCNKADNSGSNNKLIQIHKTKPNNACLKCKKQDHQIQQCPTFLALNIQDRINDAKKLRLCLNCLREGHDLRSCNSRNCKTCNNKHHTLLHLQRRENPNMMTAANHCRSGDRDIKEIILSTAVIELMDKNGQFHKARALLDVGSQNHFISEHLCTLLSLSVSNKNVSIAGIGTKSQTLTRSTEVIIKSVHDHTYLEKIRCLVIPQITNELPSESFDPTELQIPENIPLADPEFYLTARIDILIGAELFYDLLRDGRIKLNNNKTYLQNSCLGWLVGGPFTLATAQFEKRRLCLLSTSSTLSELNKNVTRFWEVENIEPKSACSPDDEVCEKLFRETHERKPNGRFIVKLPLKTNPPNLGSSKQIAIKRFKALETRFQKDPNLRQEYNNFLAEYQELDHMEQITDSEPNTQQVLYLPHHPVVKNTSLTTKTRVVFNASARTSNGLTLNDNLLTGPNLQSDLFSVILKGRMYKYALSADISKMFRQILVKTEDRDLLRIVYRFNELQPIQTYRLKTVTYGLNCAPFLAMRCLHELALQASQQYPEASKTILNCFYMDDLFVGVDNIKDGITLRDELIKILKGGGFELYKWASNEKLLLPENKNNNPTIVRLDSKYETKALGLIWNCEKDTFKYQISPIELPTNITKRNVLSVIARVFDPLGLISPILIKVKILLQTLWQLKLDWDKPIPPKLATEFKQFCTNLHAINQFEIPRSVISSAADIKSLELHGFCDASKNAYGAVLYIRSTDENNKTQVQLLCSKSRVSPIKPLSIPRLELCAAALLTKLVDKVSQLLDNKIDNIYLWSDSIVTLCWITTNPNTLQTFVAHRVTEIQRATKKEQWRYVNTDQNPADIITRGMSPQDEQKLKTWLHGPTFLLQSPDNWPKTTAKADIIPEQRRLTLASQEIQTEFKVFYRVSSYKKLKRVIAYCFRFLHNCRYPNNKKCGELNCSELTVANNFIIKSIQYKEFSKDIEKLQQHKQLSKGSSLLPLNVFLDENGLLRVGGRLANAKINFDNKHQLLLPKNNIITKLIIRDTHIESLHAGTQATLSSVRQQFWPLSGKAITRKIIYNCVRCRRVKPVEYEQLMGDLPTDRVTPARPFQNCGIDYCGPIMVRESRGRGKRAFKTYVAVFVCLATKAVHLELVHDYSAESFLNALKRMMSRRGKVSHMYSDNGTNFVGANHELQELKKLFESQNFQSVVKNLVDQGIQWKFIPPNSPYVGGIWEAAVKSFKHHFKRVTGASVLTLEEMSTLLTLIESCLNSRPLTPLNSDPNDLEPLTPGHFLIGAALTAPPEPSLLQVQENRLSRWQRVEQLRQLFWKRWTREYLTNLQARPKWQRKNAENLKIGTMVVLRDERCPPLVWKMGRVIDLHPGADNTVRVVSIKTSAGVVKRAVNRVSVLPATEDNIAV